MGGGGQQLLGMCVCLFCFLFYILRFHSAKQYITDHKSYKNLSLSLLYYLNEAGKLQAIRKRKEKKTKLKYYINMVNIYFAQIS